MQKAIKSIAETEKIIVSEIEEAVLNRDWGIVIPLTNTMEKLSKIRQELTVESLRVKSESLPTSKGFVVEVTKGAVTHSYLSATPGIAKHLLRVGQPATLVLGTNEVATIVLKFGRFQDRKNVAKFYASHKIQPGERLEFTPDDAGKWHVKKI